MIALTKAKPVVLFAFVLLLGGWIGLGANRILAAEKLDVVFGIDLTGSMGGEINQVKTHSNYIMSEIAKVVPDCAFGVVTIVDYPHSYSSYGYSDLYGDPDSGDYAYRTDLNITTNQTVVANVLNGLYLRYGADGPQDYVRMLYESQFLNWRSGATRILVVFGDAPAHDNDLFSESYGGDPGRDEIMFTADDLDYQDVIQQVKAAGIIVVSADSGGSLSSEDPYSQDVYRNFEYMASQTGGRHFMLADSSQVPQAILELIRGSIVEEFVWQQIVVDGKTYTVKVKAGKKPDDPSAFVYPVYSGECEPGYEPRAMTVVDPVDTIITDEDALRKVLAYARNAALYRSWSANTSDPIAILGKVGGFQELETTPPAKYCFLGIWPCIELGGGTDTSFGYSYPGHLTFPQEYLGINGAARLIDWNSTSVVITSILLGDYIHPTGINNYEERKQRYIELLHKMILQDGVNEISKESAESLALLLEQMAGHLKTFSGALGTATKIANVVEKVRAYSDIVEGLRVTLPTLELTKTDIDWMAKTFHSPANYTGLAAKIAPNVLSAIGVVLKVVEIGARVGGDAFAAITYAQQIQDHGAQILPVLEYQVFCTSCGSMDLAFLEAFQLVRAEFSEEFRKNFLQLMGDRFLELSKGHAADYILDTVQVGLGVAAIATGVTGIGAPIGGLCMAVNLAISAGRFIGGLIIDKLDHEKLQQAVVVCATLEYAWWQRPFKSYALTPLLVSGVVQSSDIEHLNWLVSTKLFEGTFVTDKVLEENSGFINDVRAWLGDTGLKKRRSELNSWRDRLVNVFFGRSDTDIELCRLAGRPTVDGEYIGFVPKKELDYLVDLTKPGAALAGHKMRCLLHSPGEIGIIDPAGRHLGTFGYDAGGGKFVATELNQIPRGSYSGSGSEPREVVIQEPIAGDYQISLFGTDTGAYTMEVQALSGDLVISESETHGTFEPNRLEDGVVAVEASPTGFAVDIASEPAPRSTISGTVTDSNSGSPIEGARITAGGISDITGPDGTFIIANITPGTLIISTTVRGFVPYASAETELLPGQDLVHNIKLVQPQPVDNLVDISVSHIGYDRRTNQFGVDITVADVSTNVISSPLWLVIEDINDTSTTLAFSNGVTTDGKPYLDLSGLLGDGRLDPSESVTMRIYFHNPDGVRFTFEPSVRGVIVEEPAPGPLEQLSALSTHWLGSEASLDVVPAGGDGIIDFRDFAVLAEGWLEKE